MGKDVHFICTIVFIIGSFIVLNNRGSGTPLNYDTSGIIKRNLKNFGSMVECETNSDKWRYNGYGCWCGFGGAGKPLDGLDRCCYEHDKCYDKVMAGSECTTSADPYLVSYKISGCSDCAPADEYNTWDWIGWVTIECRRAICTCDSIAAKCFRRNVFNHSLSSYDKSQCDNDINVLF